MRPSLIINLVLFAVLAPCAAQAHHPTGREPVTNDVVVARVYTQDRERLLRLGREHDLWYYIWRDAYAVIRTDRSRLPKDALVDPELTAGLVPATAAYRGTGTIPDRPCYRTVEQTHTDLAALATANPTLAQWVDYGDSWEKSQGLGGYDMTALVLGNQAVPGPKPVFMLMAASHARELTTAEVAARFAEMLFDSYGVDPDITWMLDAFEVHVLAHHNPDGRKMAEAECSGGCFPTWRKNTNQAYCGAASSSRGADLNRNSSASFWGGPFSGSSPCGITFRGASPASEPETSAMEVYAAASFPDFRDAAPGDLVTPADADADGVFISIHSSGDIVFYPWEGSDDPPPNLGGLRGLAQKMGYATTFAACQNCFLGPASGTNVDFVYEALGVPAFTFEIGTSFGESCANFEATVLPQTLEGLLAAMRHTRRSYLTPLGPDVRDVSVSENASGFTLAATADDTRRAVNGGGEPVDPGQAITEMMYTIGEPPWLAGSAFPMAATDGAFDESIEMAEAHIEAGAVSGQQLIYVFAQDDDGNTGPPAAVWVQGQTLFQDGFEVKMGSE